MPEPLETRIAPATIFAVDDNNGLFSFDSADPTIAFATLPITGLGAGELIKAMDFRPATGELYAIAISGAGPYSGRLYTLDLDTGAATAVGAEFSTTLASQSGYGMDFNPTVDRIRVTNSADENFRLHPVTGAIAGTDAPITGASVAAALAYTNSYPGAASTTLYAVDFSNDDLHIIGGVNGSPSPNGGVGTKVADIPLVSQFSDRTSLDILTTLEGNRAFYAISVAGAMRLYDLNLTTGAPSALGVIGSGSTPVFDIAAQPPAALSFPDGKSFTYTDAEGDLVTVSATAGTLKASQFSWLASEDGTRREMIRMDIAQDATFTGASLSILAKKAAAGGDGRVNVGTINAGLINLGAVKIAGNLEGLSVGTNDATIPAMKSFSALSLGRFFADDNPGKAFIFINGIVPTFTVAGDIVHAYVNPFNANVVLVGGSLIGGAAMDSGHMLVNVSKSLTLRGNVIGGSGNLSGLLDISGTPAMVKIGGSVIGGDGSASGGISLGGKTSIAVGGSIIGGSGQFSGRLLNAAPSTAKVAIAGSIIGNDGGSSGQISFGNALSVTIGGSVVAGDGLASGAVSGAGAAVMKIGGSIVGGGTNNTAGLSLGTVGTFTLGGSILAGNAAGGFSGFLHFDKAKSVTIKGAVIGQPATPAIIGFAGETNPDTAAKSIAVGVLKIGGGVVNSRILFGEGFTGAIGSVNTGGGKILIGGDFHASSIVAGFNAGVDERFGTDDDMPGAMNTLPDIKAAIGSIIIKGRASGTPGDGDHYGIVAESLGTILIAGRKLPLAAGSADNVLLGAYGDLRARENAIP